MIEMTPQVIYKIKEYQRTEGLTNLKLAEILGIHGNSLGRYLNNPGVKMNNPIVEELLIHLIPDLLIEERRNVIMNSVDLRMIILLSMVKKGIGIDELARVTTIKQSSLEYLLGNNHLSWYPEALKSIIVYLDIDPKFLPIKESSKELLLDNIDI